MKLIIKTCDELTRQRQEIRHILKVFDQDNTQINQPDKWLRSINRDRLINQTIRQSVSQSFNTIFRILHELL